MGGWRCGWLEMWVAGDVGGWRYGWPEMWVAGDMGGLHASSMIIDCRSSTLLFTSMENLG